MADVVVRADAATPYLIVESSVLVGNKGEESADVSVTAPCDEPAWLFDHAELVINRNRFGGAQFVQLPEPGCRACQPMIVRWFHEPTGYIAFEVNVFRRLVTTSCESHKAS